ncbi:MAG TPA: nitroreductase family protein [Candidatus Acidoferrum sp.]|nr:nitroreductase family protein [Candidatus Acidoferrum sp.]
MNTSTGPDLGFIFGRRSIRVYSPGEVSEAAVTRLLEAAMAAPSAMTKDPWRFVTVRERQTLLKLATLHPGAAMLSAAAMAIVVCGDLDAALERQVSYLLQDCSASIQNLLLAAHAQGLGACWVGVHPGESLIKRLKEWLALPAAVIPVAIVSLGLPGEQQPPRTRFSTAYVHREKWQK